MKTEWYSIAAVILSLMTPREVAASGICTAARFRDWRDMGCNQNYAGAGGIPQAHCPRCPGMPQWWVSEPYEDLWISDTPLSYKTSSGQEMAFKFYYRQRYRVPNLDGGQDYYVYGTSVPRLPDEYGYLARNCSITNAAWGNNWMMDIVFWDQTWENNYGNNYGHEPPVFQDGYQAYVLRPEGGIYYFYTNSSNPSLSSTKDSGTQVWLQPLSTLGYPVVIAQTPDANGIYWGGSNPQTNGFCLNYPDGSKDIFGLTYFTLSTFAGGPQPSGANSTARALLTERIDPQGRITLVGYEKLSDALAFRIKYVVDADGRTNTFRYVTNFTAFFNYTPPNPWELQEVDDPYGRKVQFGYDFDSGVLTSITDAAGLTSSFQYQAPIVTKTNYVYGNCSGGVCPTNIVGLGTGSGWITNLSTPYGNTSFSFYQVPDPTVTDGFQQRAVYVSEPTGAQQLYFYQHTNTFMAASETSPTVPGQTNFDNGSSGGSSGHGALSYRNTFHWDRRQFEALSSNVQSTISGSLSNALANLTVADYNKAELKHWLLLGADEASITEGLSSERDPSLDAAGTIPGLRTWYNYPDKPSAEELGDDPQVGCVARWLPDGTSQYITYNYYSTYPYGNGLVSDNESSYSKPDGTIGMLTNSFGYAANGIDLTSIQNSAGQYVNYGYNGSHQITSITNALNQVTTLSWDGSTYNLTGVQLPAGKSYTLSYYAGATPPTSTSAMLQQISISPEGRSFTVNNYSAGQPSNVTDDRGLTVANTWDGLNRLTSTAFPDGTSVSNIYNWLDLVATKDRLTNWTYYSFDGLQHLVTITNANNAVTTYSWCGCGSLTAILDALTNLTTLNYDNQGNLTNIVYPDNTSLTYQFDLAGRMTGASDGAGCSLQLGYNNQGLATTITGAYGTLQSIVYDALNRPISVTDANGVTVSNTFDAIGQLLKRTWPDGISEGFGYNSAGLIAYTNRDQQVTWFGRDAAGRIIAVTNANQEVIQAGYDSLDNLISLVDGLQHTTAWNYNEYGWLTNKVDGLGRNAYRYAYNANGWLTNRWTPEKGNTAYGYDAVGNLTNIFYVGQASSLSFSYDALNRLNTMLDAVGTTTFSYTPAGQLASENGPWANDTVSYLYSQMLRTNMSLNSQPSTLNFSYSYDSAWRLQSLTSPAGSFGYGYLTPSSSLLASISLPNGASIANSYDALARLKETDLNNQWNHTLDGYTYALDPPGLRTNITRNLGLTSSTVTAVYDNIGQITSWIAKEGNGTPRLNEQLGFGYDAAGSLNQRMNNALAQTFIVDSANELTNVSRTGTLTVSGATPAPASSVTVNGQAAQTYGDFIFASTNNTLMNGTNTFTIVAKNAYGVTATNTTISYLPTSISLASDANGSLTNDGTRTFAYDSENQLTNVMVTGQWRSDFIYDGLGRRRIARDYTWNVTLGTWNLTNEVRYIYDGYLPIQERDINNNVLVTYTRGLDLGGGLQRAGGIGGLLARTDANGSTFYHADGAGNITALMDGNENIVARYLYNPFGKLTGKWGSLADANVMQFSSMPQHDGLTLYPFRGYEPNLQRFLSQDPIGERGGINLYRFVANNPINAVDTDGLAVYVFYHPAGNVSSDPFYHTAIVLKPDNPSDFVNNPLFSNTGGQQATLGGQPGGPSSLWWNPWSLVGTNNYSGDNPGTNGCGSSNNHLVPVQPPPGMTDTQFINSLINAAGTYGNDAPYSFFPGLTGISVGGVYLSYNSNSYVSGVIDATGATAPNLPVSVPGYNMPLPLPYSPPLSLTH